MRRLLLTLPLLLPVVACGSATTRTIGKDTYHIECGDSISRCTNQADNLCRDRGYTILRGHYSKHHVGTEDYGYVVSDTEVVVECGLHNAKNPPTTEGNPAPSDTPSSDNAKPRDRSRELLGTSCVPGTTQRCIGPGACDGGQVCSDDGARFGVCDCGGASKAAPAVTPGSATTMEVPSVNPPTSTPIANAPSAKTSGAAQ